jgi:hypothetical protein
MTSSRCYAEAAGSELKEEGRNKHTYCILVVSVRRSHSQIPQRRKNPIVGLEAICKLINIHSEFVKKLPNPGMSLPSSSGTFQPLKHRSGTLRDRLHGYTKATLGAGGSINDAVRVCV